MCVCVSVCVVCARSPGLDSLQVQTCVCVCVCVSVLCVCVCGSPSLDSLEVLVCVCARARVCVCVCVVILQEFGRGLSHSTLDRKWEPEVSGGAHLRNEDALVAVVERVSGDAVRAAAHAHPEPLPRRLENLHLLQREREREGMNERMNELMKEERKNNRKKQRTGVINE